MNDDSRTLAVRLGKGQIDAIFARQAVAGLDDSEFLPFLEVVLTAYDKILNDAAVADELWQYAFSLYDGVCKRVQPESTGAANRKLMRSYLLGKRGGKRRRAHREPIADVP